MAGARRARLAASQCPACLMTMARPHRQQCRPDAHFPHDAISFGRCPARPRYRTALKAHAALKPCEVRIARMRSFHKRPPMGPRLTASLRHHYRRLSPRLLSPAFSFISSESFMLIRIRTRGDKHDRLIRHYDISRLHRLSLHEFLSECQATILEGSQLTE